MRIFRTILGALIGTAIVLASTHAYAGSCVTGTSNFTDVPATESYCTNTQWLVTRGITLGCTGSTYCPYDPVTRAAMALFLNRLGGVLSPSALSRQQAFTTFVPGTANGNPVCVTGTTAATAYPRVATLGGFAASGNPSAAMTLYGAPLISIDGGTYAPVSQYATASVAAGSSTTLPVSALGYIDPGHSATFALSLYQAGAVATASLATMNCQLQVSLHNQNADGPRSSVPSAPITFSKDSVFTLNSGTTNYVYVPDTYDSTHATPMPLLVWLHGCDGYASGDIYVVTLSNTQGYIGMAVGGAEGGCWNVNTDVAKVMAALADIKTHFNIDPRRVIIGGYSSGGDLGYRTIFYNALSFAGILAENTDPFRDTGSNPSASLAAAAWKFNVVHLAHLQDTTYAVSLVETDTNALISAGYPMTRIERTGTHYDDANALVAGVHVPGTDADLQTLLLPYMTVGWTSP